QYAFPTRVTRGAAEEIPSSRVSTTATYDFNTGRQRSATDANGRTTWFDYGPVSLRLGTKTLPTGATISFDYNDADLAVVETNQTATGDIALQTIRRLNGRQLLRRTEVRADSASTWNRLDYQYNEMGQPLKQSNSYQAGQLPQWTDVTYDDA